ncbi:ABC transporter ATP-binding protein [uncultured Aeromicrobium sp.]|uniref:ABC transporter ATP-binding protein n=1 Tax=uncultured Aeromicrobium sp. TaxID=337820 RepID=UPI0025E97101|nr:ABC transporter ATP-binding protein [uncultured Aeromicrobium sp.]
MSQNTIESRSGEHAGASINVEKVRKRYGGTTVLDDVSLDIRAGEFITLLGASGSGKSTLLNIIAGFTKADGGRIHLGGRDLTKVPAHRRGLGMVFQHYALFPHMTVFDNVAYGLRRHGTKKSAIAGLVAEALQMVELGHLAERKPSELSGGQQQRVALARAIVFRPPVLLMDEPLGALDKLLREQLQLEIRRLHQDMGITFVFVTHDQEEALTMSDRIALLQAGNIVQIGSPADLYERPNCRYAAEFIGVSNIFSGECRDGVFDDRVNGARYRIDSTVSGQALMVRPERLAVQPGTGLSETDVNAVEAVVEDCVYLGSFRTVHARTNGGDLVVARTEVPRGDDGVHPGAKVTLTWKIEDGRVLA